MTSFSRFFGCIGILVLLGIYGSVGCGNPQLFIQEKSLPQDGTISSQHESSPGLDGGSFEPTDIPDLLQNSGLESSSIDRTPDSQQTTEFSKTTEPAILPDDVMSEPSPTESQQNAPEPVSEPASPVEQEPKTNLLSGMDRAKLLLVLGDSIGAGYNASKGRSFDALLYQNTAYPSYQGYDLQTRYPGILWKNIAKSGANSSDMLSRLKSNLGSLPTTGPQEDTLVLISIGGNDFNDKIQTMLLPTAAIQAYEKNITDVVTLLRQKYEDKNTGRQLLIFLHNIHDPTGGTAKIPPQYTDGFCKLLQNPLLATVASTVLKNLADFNTKIATISQKFNLHLIDTHAAFLQHGMNATDSSRWIDKDCVHFNNEGHHQLRRLIWEKMTGQSY